VGTPPDALAEFELTLEGVEIEAVPTGVEAAHLPLRVAELLRRRGTELVPIDDLVRDARVQKGASELEAIRRACHLADVAQRTVKDAAAPDMTEIEIAGLAQAAIFRAAGRRLPAILTVTAGADSATGGRAAGPQRVRAGDIVLTDVAPWIAGAWADTANAVVAGRPTTEHRRMFDAVRRALELALELCRPGAVAGEIHRQVHASLSDWGDEAYFHHTGHGIGASWAERPLIVPESTDVLDEGMVVALEPGLYRPGLGGLRLEHVALIRAAGSEILTQFEHTL
jgi:Xaa-Pro dipeptidase